MAQPLEILDTLAEMQDRYHRWDIERLQTNEKYNEIKSKIDGKLIQEIQSCHETATSVNIQNITNKLQPYFNTHHNIDLQHTFWQSHIAQTMARTLTTLNFQQVQSPTSNQQDIIDMAHTWQCYVCNYRNVSGDTCAVCHEKREEHSPSLPIAISVRKSGGNPNSDDIKETLELEALVSEPGPGFDLQNPNHLWNEIQRDIAEQERKLNLDPEDSASSLSKSNGIQTIQCDTIPVRWKSRSDFKVDRGISTTQITKIGSSYSSIFSLDPMVSRKYKYTFLLSDIRETGKPWIGIGIISSKCPLVSANQSIAWHGSNAYSIGWYYGTEIWHEHAPLRSNYGNGSYWKSGDEIQLIVDCKNYTLQYRLNGMDLGIAASNFDKLLNSDKRCHFYVIISVQHNMNAITLMDAHRYREDRKQRRNSRNDSHFDSCSTLSRPVSNPFISVDSSSFVTKKEDTKRCEDEEMESLRDKLMFSTKISAVFKQKWEKLIVSYRELEQVNKENTNELKKLKQVAIANQKELNLSRGVMHELKKLSIHKLHELEAHLLGSIQNVQKSIANQYENKYDCRVCMTNEKDTVLIPCGHFLCSQCVAKVNECPMCRANIEKTVKLN
eukprot:59821_1